MKHTLSNKVFKGAWIFKLTPRGYWLVDQSKRRFLKRPDAEPSPLTFGEIGSLDGIIIHTTRNG